MTKDKIKEYLKQLRDGEIDIQTVFTAVEAYSSASNNGNAIVSGSLPPDFEIDIYPSYDKGKWAARCQGIITEAFDTPQDALNWGMSKAAMTV